MRFFALHPKPCKARLFYHLETRWKNTSQNVPHVQEIPNGWVTLGSPAPCFIFQRFFLRFPLRASAWTTTLALFHEGFVIISYCTAPYVAYGWTMNELLVGTPGWVKVCVKFGRHWLYSLYSVSGNDDTVRIWSKTSKCKHFFLRGQENHCLCFISDLSLHEFRFASMCESSDHFAFAKIFCWPILNSTDFMNDCD